MWLTDFKKAIILKEFETLGHLIDEMPPMESLSQMEEAAYLLHHAKTLLETEQSVTLGSIQQLKNTIDFLKATENTPVSSLNLKL
ncbi:MAG: hypothetical protein QG558_380 [Campylobacterota bacterium]|nr:hypothetical protein [Campylobacterota bacterium]